MWVRKVQLEYCCESNLFASSDDNLTLQNYKHFPIPQAFWRKKRISPKETLHLRIRRMNQSSSGLNPQKVLPSPPKSHGSVTSIGLFGSRSYWPLPIIIRSRRRNLRLQNCFPRFCDLQQQQVLAGVFFLLLLIMSRMLRVVAVSICATQLNITRLQFLMFVSYLIFFFSPQNYQYSPNGNGILADL